MNTPYRLQLLALPLVALLAATIAGCPPWANNQPAQQFGDAKLVPFESADEFLSYFQQQARARTRSRWAWGPLLFGAPLFAAAPEGEADGGTTATEDTGASGTAGQSFSTTNIQEVGVDESDVMKSDGTYFYIARGDTLRIVRADPLGELAEVGRLDLDLYADELYLYGSKLLILAQRYEQYEPGERPEIMIWPPYYVGSNLTVLEVDVADPTAPELTRQIELDGALVDSRLTGGRLILVLSIAPELPAEPTPLTIGLMTLEQVLPKARSGETERHMVDWEDCLHPESPDGYFLTAVVTLDAADIETIVHSVAVVAEAGTIYASPEALYVTDSDYDADDNYRETTEIHKFAFDEEGAARYVASGEVPGRLLNQFSLGEYQEYLRVATHVADAAFFGMFADIPVSSGGGAAAQDMEPPAEFSAVYVLHQTDSTLEVVGAVENIAPGEDLHSARFISDHGFVVTYHKVDPLFVLDLSDPTDPQVVGELVVPGFSDYLHPLDDTHLIGVGRATVPTDEGFDWFQGVQLSLFDVSNWSEPQVVQQITLGGRCSESEVDYTHKAFTFLPDRGLLAIPVRLYAETEIPWDCGAFEFDGVIAFQVDAASGFTELARLETVGAGTGSDCCWYDWNAWARAAFIGDTLYAVSPDGVAGAPLDDPDSAVSIEFEE